MGLLVSKHAQDIKLAVQVVVEAVHIICKKPRLVTEDAVQYIVSTPGPLGVLVLVVDKALKREHH